MQWSPQQDSALRAVSAWLNDPDAKQVFRLFGWAGTGKSTLARHLAEDVKKVCFAAYTGKAALVMRKRGCVGATTIHSLIYTLDKEEGGEPTFRLNEDSEVRRAGLVVIDEVSMVDEVLGSDLLSFGTKILVLGDPFQLPPVKSDKPDGFFTSDEPDVMLTEIHRQAADNPIIRMSMDIRESGRLSYGTYGDSKVIRRSDVASGEVLAADQVLVGKNKSRIDYNHRIRELRGFTASIPEPGERVICLRNDHGKHLLNGQIWTVKSSKLKGGRAYEMVIDPEDAGSRVSDAKVRCHQAWLDGTDDEMTWGEKRAYDWFTFGHAITVHKAQGSQWDRVYLFDEGYVFREDRARWLYTGVTRAAEQITVVS